MRGAVQASSATVSWAPLALTLGLHLLLMLAWLLRPGVQAQPPAPGERETTLVMLAAPPRPAHAVSRPSLPPRLAPRLRPQAAPARAPSADTLEAQPISAPVEAVTEAATDATSEAPSAPLPGELLASARRMAGRIGRELGNGANPLGAEPEGKWERFADTVASARLDAGHGVSLDSHTAPDGVVVYRKTVGNRVRCYRSGSVGGINPSDGHSAGNIACPTGVRWTRL
jgi:hypothetical protein